MLRIDKYQNDDRSKFFRSVSLLYEFQLTGQKSWLVKVDGLVPESNVEAEG